MLVHTPTINDKRDLIIFIVLMVIMMMLASITAIMITSVIIIMRALDLRDLGLEIKARKDKYRKMIVVGASGLVLGLIAFVIVIIKVTKEIIHL